MNRVMIACGVLVCLAGLYLWFFAGATLMAIEARYMGWKVPLTRKLPKPLNDHSIAESPGAKLSYGGYTFEVPWHDVEPGTRLLSNGAVVSFRSGLRIAILSGPPLEIVGALCSEADKRKPGVMKQLYGEDVLRSDYDLQRAVLEATPNRAAIFSNRTELVRNSTLVTLKAIVLPRDSESGIFEVSNGVLKGFQYGDPATHPKGITVDLYGEGGHVELLFGQKGEPLSLTQAEINRVIQTIEMTGPKLPAHNVPAACL